MGNFDEVGQFTSQLRICSLKMAVAGTRSDQVSSAEF